MSLLSLPQLGSDSLRRLCTTHGCLVAATQSGSLLLYSSRSIVPELQRSWRLPCAACSIAAVALPSGSVVIIAGAQSGELFVAGPGEEVLHVQKTQWPGAITKLLLGPATDGLGGILQDKTADGPRALFIAGSDGRILRAWLPEEAGSSGSKDMTRAVAEAIERASEASSVCAELFSPILDMELCPKTARLLVSTAERIAVISDALAAEVSPLCWVGSKPHRGRFTATFGNFFGPDAIIAARPGSRLWVADSCGTVQRTLIFQSAAGEGKAALGHLLTLRNDQVLSFARCDEASEGSVGAPVVVLDLEAIAISHQWPAPPVVDAVPWHGGVLLGHPCAISLLLLSDQPLLTCKALIAMHNLSDPVCLAECLKELQRVQQSLDSISADEVLEGLAPLIQVISESDGLDFRDFREWVAKLEEQQLASLRQAAGEGKHKCIRLVDAPLSNFPVASADVDEEESLGGKEDHATGIGDGEGLFAPDMWQKCLSELKASQPDVGLSVPMPIEALEAPGRGSKSLPIVKSLLLWLAARLEEETDDLAEPAALTFELLCSAQDWPSTGVFLESGAVEPWSREHLVLHLRSFAQSQGTRPPWPASAALGILQLCMESASFEILERCFFWANGMVTQPGALGPGWHEVISWIRHRLRPNAWALGLSPWTEALEAVHGSVSAVHSLFQQAMAPESSVPVRDVFDAAVEVFPKVLPWNVAEWMAWAFQPSPANQPWPHKLRREALLHELPQYFLRLLPTCNRLCDEQLLDALFSLVLQRRPIEVGTEPPVYGIHAARCSLADSLLLRYGKDSIYGENCEKLGLMGLELCHRLRYPLGVLLCCTKGQPTGGVVLEEIRGLSARTFDPFRLDSAQDFRLADHEFEEVVLAALQAATPKTDRIDVPTTADKAAPSPHSECTSSGSQSRGEVKCSSQDGRLNCWYDLALALWKLSKAENGSHSHRWRYVLDSAANPGLLAALAALSPSAVVAEVCLRNAAQLTAWKGPLVESTFAAAEVLWSDASAGEWLQLPRQRRLRPPRPRPWQPPQVHSEPGVPDGLRKAGRGDLLWLSDDGLHARHLDDTGDVMHGVLTGIRPLPHCRAGAYFEVTLEEVRPGESPDGLTLGVTATSPDALPNDSPATLEHIPETWSLGYDGQMWDCESGTLTQVDWDPRSLAEGDVVGLLVTASEGELLIFRNGTAVAAGPRGIPINSRELYAVVDLLGAARAVHWMTEASPP